MPTGIDADMANIGSYIPDDVERFMTGRNQRIFDRAFAGSEENILMKQRVGNSEQRTWLTCPYGYAVAGVVGSGISSMFPGMQLDYELSKSLKRASAEHVGNMGLVCMPYSPPERYGESFARAVVVASGSRDVAFHSPPKTTIFPSIPPSIDWPMDWGTITEVNAIPIYEYLNEYLTTMGNYTRTFHCPDSLQGNRSHLYRHQSYPQELSMCPPGYYVESFDINMPSWTPPNFDRIGQIQGMMCRSWSGDNTLWIKSQIGENWFGRYGSNVHRLGCGGIRSVLVGLSVSIGDFLAGIHNPWCQQARPF